LFEQPPHPALLLKSGMPQGKQGRRSAGAVEVYPDERFFRDR
jgi:hypothetical protein